ncbi:hypothetical protein Pmani_022135 [Petrolisthes manimaculis]|uniref:Uncharacterized protein n=1 Tax=Petrolisthes manimaculis TaxID=1843537 RepID=A0AAE1PCC5_9EUCA|nr:hypothetical protein Pmani_022135 [Petrolisthes manimaculis]
MKQREEDKTELERDGRKEKKKRERQSGGREGKVKKESDGREEEKRDGGRGSKAKVGPPVRAAANPVWRGGASGGLVGHTRAPRTPAGGQAGSRTPTGHQQMQHVQDALKDMDRV